MNLKRFLILAIVGFALGAALAFFQNSNEPTATPLVAETTASTTEAATSTDHAGMEGMDHGDTAGVAGSSVGGPFTLTDFNDQVVTDKSWPGKLKVVFFGFTNCPDICPVGLDKISNALGKLGASADQFQVLMITTDQKRDTPVVMKEYLGKFNPAFIGLTGTEQQLKSVQEAYKVYAAEEPADKEGEAPKMNHSGYIYLMDEDNKMLEIMSHSDTVDEITAKLQKHVKAAAAVVDPAIDSGAVSPAATDAAPAADAAPATDASAPAAAPEAAPAATETVPAPGTEAVPPMPATDAPAEKSAE